jgi:hypothetical protein
MAGKTGCILLDLHHKRLRGSYQLLTPDSGSDVQGLCNLAGNERAIMLVKVCPDTLLRTGSQGGESGRLTKQPNMSEL